MAPLVEMLLALRALRGELGARVADAAARLEIDERLAEEEADIEAALAKAQRLEIEARADDGLVTPGETFGVTVSAWNEGRSAVALEDVTLETPAGWISERRAGETGELGPGARGCCVSPSRSPRRRASRSPTGGACRTAIATSCSCRRTRRCRGARRTSWRASRVGSAGPS